MAYSETFNKRMVTFDGIDIVFDEQGSGFLSIRKVQWVEEGVEPDPEKAKLEMRKYIIGKDGEEIIGKGVPFLTERGPHNLAEELIKNGYGDTKEVLSLISQRDDFKETVENLYTTKKEDSSTGEFFDMRAALLDYGDDYDDGELEIEKMDDEYEENVG